MRFSKGQSGNPRGRPKGKPDRRTAARELFEGHRQELIDKAVELALNGDTAALRLCLDRIVPAIKPAAAPVVLKLPKNGGLAGAGEAVLSAISRGKLPADVGAQLLAALGQQARIVEIDDIVRRLEALENAGTTTE
jgi:hypothetical protein